MDEGEVDGEKEKEGEDEGEVEGEKEEEGEADVNGTDVVEEGSKEHVKSCKSTNVDFPRYWNLVNLPTNPGLDSGR